MVAALGEREKPLTPLDDNQNLQTTPTSKFGCPSLTNNSANHCKTAHPAHVEFILDKSWPSVGRGNGLVLLQCVSGPKDSSAKQFYRWMRYDKASRLANPS